MASAFVSVNERVSYLNESVRIMFMRRKKCPEYVSDTRKDSQCPKIKPAHE
jgi:hypothetical protein